MRPAPPILKLILTGGGIGNVPRCPGTAMSFVTVALLWFVPNPGILVAFVAITAVGFLTVPSVESIFREADPKRVVIDEASGMAGALLFVPHTPICFITAFCLFRFFDSVKPLGIRRVEALHTPQAILWDDLLAALYTNLLIQIWFRIVLG